MGQEEKIIEATESFFAVDDLAAQKLAIELSEHVNNKLVSAQQTCNIS